ncbi:hypothetical protein CEXT_132881, partial [Caerostris extrusa]
RRHRYCIQITVENEFDLVERLSDLYSNAAKFYSLSDELAASLVQGFLAETLISRS